jgi:hypothetical protein
MGQELVMTDYNVLSESSVRLLATKQVERSNQAVPASKSIAVKPLQKERDCTPLPHNNTMPKYTVSSRKCVSGELDFSSKPRSLRRCMSGEMTVVPPTAENVELMGREEKKTVEVSAAFLD